MQFLNFSGPCQNLPKVPPKRARSFLPTNPELVDILGDTYFDFENFYLLVCEVVWEFLFMHFNGQGLNGKEDSMDGEGFNGW